MKDVVEENEHCKKEEENADDKAEEIEEKKHDGEKTNEENDLRDVKWAIEADESIEGNNKTKEEYEKEAIVGDTFKEGVE